MPDWRAPCVYILASGFHGTLYTGVTSDLMTRIYQHRGSLFGGFTARYDVRRLVWIEGCETIDGAIAREKSIKRWRRAWKYALIEADNPTWRDLAEDMGFPSLIKRHPGLEPGPTCLRAAGRCLGNGGR